MTPPAIDWTIHDSTLVALVALCAGGVRAGLKKLQELNVALVAMNSTHEKLGIQIHDLSGEFRVHSTKLAELSQDLRSAVKDQESKYMGLVTRLAVLEAWNQRGAREVARDRERANERERERGDDWERRRDDT